MTHLYYHQVKARSHFELGYKLAPLFKQAYFKTYQNSIEKAASNKMLVTNTQLYLRFVSYTFPHLIEELKGYANGLGVEFGNFWLSYLYSALDIQQDKCTSCYSADGMIIGHNEDNYSFLSDSISILEKTVDDITIFELYYSHSLGGDACSINSHGFVQTVNSLHHVDSQVGIPNNIIARWLSETQNPIKDFEVLKSLTRDAGYSHTFGNLQGNIVNFESTARHLELVEPKLPFVHTNHYLSQLSQYEKQTHAGNSVERLDYAQSLIGSVKTSQDMMMLLEKVTSLPSNDMRESKTLARMVFDLKEKVVWCWLLRESSMGWIKYPLSFL